MKAVRGWVWIFSGIVQYASVSPYGFANLKTKHLSPFIFFVLNTVKVTAKASAVDLLRWNTLKGAKPPF